MDNAPSVDDVGRARGLIKESGGLQRDTTLNQLLVCLDEFEGKGEVITIASINRPDILDPALVRPGRFDRKICLHKPGVIGRIEILKVHAWKKPMAPDVGYLAVATMTDGMVGAELANIIEIAAINMLRDGRTKITSDDLQIEERGIRDKRDSSPDIWKQVAIKEAAMAIITANFWDLRNIEFSTISPRAGRELGYVRFNLVELHRSDDLYYHTRTETVTTANRQCGSSIVKRKCRTRQLETAQSRKNGSGRKSFAWGLGPT